MYGTDGRLDFTWVRAANSQLEIRWASPDAS